MIDDPGDKPAPEGSDPEPRETKPWPLLIKVFLSLCVVLLVLDFGFLHLRHHVVHPWENLFGFYALYGFVACVLLVLAAKQLRKVVMRKEDYYDAD